MRVRANVFFVCLAGVKDAGRTRIYRLWTFKLVRRWQYRPHHPTILSLSYSNSPHSVTFFLSLRGRKKQHKNTPTPTLPPSLHAKFSLPHALQIPHEWIFCVLLCSLALTRSPSFLFRFRFVLFEDLLLSSQLISIHILCCGLERPK